MMFGSKLPGFKTACSPTSVCQKPLYRLSEAYYCPCSALVHSYKVLAPMIRFRRDTFLPPVKVAHYQVFVYLHTLFHLVQMLRVNVFVQSLLLLVDSLIRFMNHGSTLIDCFLRFQLLMVHQKWHKTFKLALDLFRVISTSATSAEARLPILFSMRAGR